MNPRGETCGVGHGKERAFFVGPYDNVLWLFAMQSFTEIGMSEEENLLYFLQDRKARRDIQREAQKEAE